MKPNIRTTAFGEDNAGEIYFCDYDTGFLYTLERNDAGAGEQQVSDEVERHGSYSRT